MRISRKTAALAAAMTGLLSGTVARVNAQDTQGKDTGKATSKKAVAEKHSCAGKNSCKGRGGCSTGDNGCSGRNSCKGKGGCATDGSKKK